MIFLDLANEIINRLLEIVRAPYYAYDMLWMLVPLFIALLLMELYFGRYKKEELGWNTAFGNSLVLIFVCVDLFRWLYTHNSLNFFSLKMMLAVSVGVIGIMLTIIDFFHLLPKTLAYGLGSKLPMNFIACMAVILVYTDIKINFVTFLASVTLFVLLAAVIRMIQMFEPAVIEE